MNVISTRIKEFFENENWKYDYEENDNIFITGLNMGQTLGNIDVYVLVTEDSYTVYSVINNKAEEVNYSLVSEYLHRANYGLRSGNFEIDYNDGEIRYKVYVDCEGAELSKQIIGNSILLGARMIDRYGKGLLKVMLGVETPEGAIEQAEKE